MTFVDTNVLIDILGKHGRWREWSASRLTDAGETGSARTNAIVVAELSRDFTSYDVLRTWLASFEVIVEPLDEAAAFDAGKRFQQFRRNRKGEESARVLPDFLIGSHALALRMPLLTRDTAIYRRYFPDLPLITPETQP